MTFWSKRGGRLNGGSGLGWPIYIYIYISIYVRVAILRFGGLASPGPWGLAPGPGSSRKLEEIDAWALGGGDLMPGGGDRSLEGGGAKGCRSEVRGGDLRAGAPKSRDSMYRCVSMGFERKWGL